MQEDHKIATRGSLIVASAAGIVGPILFAVVLVIASSLRWIASFLGWPGYKPYQHYVSELGVGPFAYLQNLNFIVFGVLMVAFAGGLWHGMPKEGNLKVGAFLVGVFGLSLVFMGLSPMDPSTPSELGAAPEAKAGGIVHLLAFVIAFGSVIPACFIFAKGAWQNDRSQRYGNYSLLTGVAATFFYLMILVIWPMIDEPILTNFFGWPDDHPNYPRGP